MADVEKAEPEYVPADYVAPADADEQAKGGSRWAPVCDWPLAFRSCESSIASSLIHSHPLVVTY